MPKEKNFSKTETVKVVVRCRPPNEEEKLNHSQIIVNVDEETRQIRVVNPKPEKSSHAPVRDFTFDSVFAPGCKQQSIFEDTALPIVQSCLQGYNGTIFAYGQTGTGKTYTMCGENEPHKWGIVRRTIKYIFKAIQQAATTKKYLVRCSFLELYNEHLIDLLGSLEKSKKQKEKEKEKKGGLQIQQIPGQGIKVNGLKEVLIENEKEIMNKYEQGNSQRHVAHTLMNAESSRSHSIFSIIIQNQEEIDGKVMISAGKLNLVDLAGSQRNSKTGVTGVEREQAININLSLTTLGLVIQNLVNPKSTHVPYRDSKLTRLLQDSLGGNTKTVMIANVGPSAYNFDETISTLKYANRAKNIKNDVKKNQDPKDALLRHFQEEIKKLREQVAKNIGGEHGEFVVEGEIGSDQDVEEFEEKIRVQKEKLKKKFDQERSVIYKKKNMLEEEKNKLLKDIEEKEKQQQIFRENQQALIKKLKKMEEKVLSGHQEQQAALKNADILHKKLKQLQDKRTQHRNIEENLKEKEENIDEIKKTYKNLQQENQDKKVQLKRKVKRLKALQNQNKQLEDMYGKQIEDLQERRRLLQKELKLKNFIIQYFVPASYQDLIKSKAVWSDEIDSWQLPNLEISGNSIRHKNPEIDMKQDMNQEDLKQAEINELAKLQLENHPNVYFTYKDDQLVRELQPKIPKEKKKKMKKRPAAKI